MQSSALAGGELAGRPLPERAAKSVILAALCAAAVLLIWQGRAAGPLDDLLATMLLVAAGAIGYAWPILDARANRLPMAPLVALVGCDGSGKTTLSHDILAGLAIDRPASICYLGLGSGALGERLKAVPLIGHAIEHKLALKAKQARTTGQKIPGLATAIIVYAFSLARLRRFRRMLAQRRLGVTIITDRYPQIEVPGFYDGPGLSAARPGGRIVAALARSERRMYDWMASFRPDLIIRLNVDAHTAHARKPDHRFDLLRQKVEATAGLLFSGARIVDLDSCRPYPAVRAEAERMIRQTLR